MRARIALVYEGTGLTQGEFAKRLGQRQGVVQRWLSADKGTLPEAEALFGLATEFGVSVHWLLTGEGDRAAPGFPSFDPYAQAREQVRAELRARVFRAVAGALTDEDPADPVADDELIARALEAAARRLGSSSPVLPRLVPPGGATGTPDGEESR